MCWTLENPRVGERQRSSPLKGTPKRRNNAHWKRLRKDERRPGEHEERGEGTKSSGKWSHSEENLLICLVGFFRTSLLKGKKRRRAQPTSQKHTFPRQALNNVCTKAIASSRSLQREAKGCESRGLGIKRGNLENKSKEFSSITRLLSRECRLRGRTSSPCYVPVSTVKEEGGEKKVGGQIRNNQVQRHQHDPPEVIALAFRDDIVH